MSFIINPYAFGAVSPITLLDSTKVGGGSTATPAIDTTGASLIVIAEGNFNTTPTVSDNQGNTWTALTEYGSGWLIRLFYCISPTTNASHTFTTGTGVPSLIAAAFDLTGAFDAATGTAGAGTSGGTTTQPGNLTPANDNSLVIAAYADGAESGTPTVDSSFTIIDFVLQAAGVNVMTTLAYKVQTSAATENPTFTNPVSFAIDAPAASAAFEHA